MRKLITLFLTVLTLVCIAVPAHAENGESRPLYASDIANGSYEITVDSSASMFRVVACTLTVTDTDMTAVMTMSGKGYGKLFMGRGEAALNANESSFILSEETPEGMICFTVPVPALDTPVQCAAWSRKREQWYDRDLVFRSDSLPQGAVKSSSTAALIIAAVICAAALICSAAVITIRMKKKKEKDPPHSS